MHRKLGQHLLINKHIAEREVNYAGISKEDVVLEVGPGKGILTLILAERAKEVVAVEIDHRFVNFLKSITPDNVRIIHGDILKIDLRSINFNKVVANLPFSISSPFTFRLLDSSFSKAILIYQKHFAKRMVAKPGSKEYSRLSVAVYYKAHCGILEHVPKNAFRPIPQVDASIVELIPREKPPFKVADEDFFFSVVNLLFSQRRKYIGKVIRKEFGINVPAHLSEKRVEELIPEEIGELSDFILYSSKKVSQ
ncbi:MAG: ribosomal RNA small subunit methyltransferase A [Thermoplasmata archaeon]|nr:ribosomal RNA small subunit methyltransferase A [Thermoplasmata archaeon]